MIGPARASNPESPITVARQRVPGRYQQRHRGRLVPIVKNSQKQSKDSQNSKNDHWCTNRHMSTKTVPTVYQQCTKNSQKTVKTAKNDHWCTNRHTSTKTLPTIYQKQSKDSQNNKNDHSCTNRHRTSSKNTSSQAVGGGTGVRWPKPPKPPA